MSLVTMPDGEDFLMRPVVRGLCSYRDLLDGSALDLSDFQRMNDGLDAADENERRLNAKDD